MSIEPGNKINQLLQSRLPGGLLFSSWLKKKGYSDQLLKHYRNSGWLSYISKGVMYRTGEKLSAYAVLSSFNAQLDKKFYVGAHSALEISGFSHYVPMGKPVLQIGHPTQDKVPGWMTGLEMEQDLKFFSTDTFAEPQIVSHRQGDCEILISVPEQAFLECLLLAPEQYNYMDLYYIMEQLTALRPEVLQSLLENTDNIKVKRLFLYMAQKAGHYWFQALDKSKIELGTAKRKLTANGIYIPEYKITIPKELYEYE
ncbi:MAG: type IV toxin-antitoxin system AbiEi family antitoxin [Phocaeicola dorei]|nr:type IV toxin-antitoxin system AbiEi family antitoxin [Phocaeicola dorei]